MAHGLIEDLCFLGALPEKLKDRRAVNLVQGLLSSAHAIIEMGPAESVPISAVYYREGSQAGIRVAAQHGGQRRFGKLSIGAFRKHSHAGSGAHEPIETAGVSSDLPAKLLRRLRTVFDKIGNAEPRKARNRAGNADAVQQLKHANVRRRCMALRSRCRRRSRCVHFVHQAFDLRLRELPTFYTRTTLADVVSMLNRP